MALNWALISEDGSRPVPLPDEKFFFSVEKCSLSLDFRHQGVKWSANGNAYVTSKRILFLRQPALPAPADPSISSTHLRSLSVPLKQFVDTRYLIPVFTAPYFEASIIPSIDGGLPQRTSGSGSSSNNTGLFKLWFNEGGGMAFRDAVEEVKSRLEEGSTHIEALPLYEPPEGNQSTSSSHPPDLSNLQITNEEPTRSAPPPPRPNRSGSMLQPEDIAAANVAIEAEERERDQERQRSQSIAGQGTQAIPPALTGDPNPADVRDDPPPYLA
ncbi:hypothetical protein L7F22_003128 [Adiantum nelumboides]|nr:hypothetical protein [Adiantum nelumboides]